MRAGLLNRLTSIQMRTSTAAGDTWAEIRRQWVSITPVGAAKLGFLSAQGSKVTHTVIARETPFLQIGQRIVDDLGDVYQITSVQRIRGDRQEATAEQLQ